MSSTFSDLYLHLVFGTKHRARVIRPEWKERLHAIGERAFEWQEGYGAFSVSHSGVARVREYIKNQEAHHRKKSFDDEYRELLRRHGIEFRDDEFGR